MKIHKNTVFIGIDTGTETGLAIGSNGELKTLKTVKIHQAMTDVMNQVIYAKVAENNKNVLIRVEDARQRKWFGKKEKTGNALQGVGSVKRDASIWEDYLTDLKKDFPNVVDFEMVAPCKNQTKLSAEAFKQKTGFTGRTNEHNRDAGMLIWDWVKTMGVAND